MLIRIKHLCVLFPEWVYFARDCYLKAEYCYHHALVMATLKDIGRIQKPKVNHSRTAGERDTIIHREALMSSRRQLKLCVREIICLCNEAPWNLGAWKIKQSWKVSGNGLLGGFSGFRMSELQLKAVFGQMRFLSFYTWVGALKVILGHVFYYKCQMRWELFAQNLFLSD